MIFLRIVYDSFAVNIFYLLVYLIIDFCVLYSEEVQSKAWLVILWNSGRVTTVSLGVKPVTFGVSRKAVIRLPLHSFPANTPGIYAVCTMKYDGGIYIDNYLTGERRDLQNGSCVDLGLIGLIVQTKKIGVGG
jgi:hypothetical protein